MSGLLTAVKGGMAQVFTTLCSLGLTETVTFRKLKPADQQPNYDAATGEYTGNALYDETAVLVTFQKRRSLIAVRSGKRQYAIVPDSEIVMFPDDGNYMPTTEHEIVRGDKSIWAITGIDDDFGMWTLDVEVKST